METIPAVYKDGVFKPLGPVALPEGTPVRVEAELTRDERDERLRQQLIARGSTREKADKMLAQLHLAWDLFDSLTPEEEQALEEAKFDQVNFFKRPYMP